MKDYNPTYKQRKEMERINKNIPPYHYNHTPEEKAWFDKKSADCKALGFIWNEVDGAFVREDGCIFWWEQICRWDNNTWLNVVADTIRVMSVDELLH